MKKKKPGFTERQMDVLKLMVLGKSNKDISEKLCICNSTVKAHLTGIFEKLGVKKQNRSHKNGYLKKDYSSSRLRTAIKASCGTSTRPTDFIRFLPFFCFSKSFRLREISPP